MAHAHRQEERRRAVGPLRVDVDTCGASRVDAAAVISFRTACTIRDALRDRPSPFPDRDAMELRLAEPVIRVVHVMARWSLARSLSTIGAKPAVVGGRLAPAGQAGRLRLRTFTRELWTIRSSTRGLSTIRSFTRGGSTIRRTRACAADPLDDPRRASKRLIRRARVSSPRRSTLEPRRQSNNLARECV